jgi:enoyl-CoA hydratase
MDQVLIDKPQEGVTRITLNRPDKLNAFSYTMYREFLAALEQIRYDTATRVVILTGAGKGFCARHDVSGSGGQPDWVPDDMAPADKNRAILAVIGHLPMAMRNLPQPVIGAINGAAAGMGYALALSTDICLVTKATKLVPSFHNAGTGSELGMSWLLPRMVGLQHAMDILLTGKPMQGEEAARIGLAARCSEDSEALAADALSTAAQICNNVPWAVNLAKHSVWSNLSVGSFDAALEIELRAIVIAGNSDDAKERRKAAFEKRAPKYQNR